MHAFLRMNAFLGMLFYACMIIIQISSKVEPTRLFMHISSFFHALLLKIIIKWPKIYNNDKFCGEICHCYKYFALRAKLFALQYPQQHISIPFPKALRIKQTKDNKIYERLKFSRRKF